jgi:hypothetical protein
MYNYMNRTSLLILSAISKFQLLYTVRQAREEKNPGRSTGTSCSPKMPPTYTSSKQLHPLTL